MSANANLAAVICVVCAYCGGTANAMHAHQAIVLLLLAVSVAGAVVFYREARR